MNWIKLKDEATLKEIKALSHEKPVVIFKHSTRCNISTTALSRLERTWKSDGIKPVSTYFLDLLSYRDISNKIEDVFDIEHQSPQLLLIQNGICTYHTSHLGITFEEIKKRIPFESLSES
ncbi:MAG TPA: bacillithiol system redox-active protein YtxJ [Cytophagales bacterium]|nr:bacillithiol system redox-active protein YtxJ [Cytophagales bacterium]